MNITLETNKRMLVSIIAINLGNHFRSRLLQSIKAFIEKQLRYPISYIGKDKIGFGIYRLNLLSSIKNIVNNPQGLSI